MFVPPNWDERYITCFGSTMVEVFEVGANSLDAKLRAAGMPPEELPGGVPLEPDLSSEDRAKRGIAFLRGNILGEKNGPPSTDPELLDEYFDSIRRGLSAAYDGREPITLQWDFRDLEPWHLQHRQRLEPRWRAGGSSRRTSPYAAASRTGSTSRWAARTPARALARRPRDPARQAARAVARAQPVPALTVRSRERVP